MVSVAKNSANAILNLLDSVLSLYFQHGGVFCLVGLFVEDFYCNFLGLGLGFLSL